MITFDTFGINEKVQIVVSLLKIAHVLSYNLGKVRYQDTYHENLINQIYLSKLQAKTIIFRDFVKFWIPAN